MTQITSTHTALAKANHVVKPAISGVEEEHHREGAGMSVQPVAFSITLWFQLWEMMRENNGDSRSKLRKKNK